MERRRRAELEHQHWYHGLLPWWEIQSYLQQHGDFLVRAMQKEGETLKLMISCKCEQNIQHFPIGRDQNGWHLAQTSFATVYDLIQHYKKHSKCLAPNSTAILRKGVHRPPWMLSNRQVRLKKKLGDGQFGEVWKGTLVRGNEERPVAIKKAKGKFTEEERDRLLNEAKLMLTYDQENVLKVYGVAATRMPLMIVLELCVKGGLDDYVRKRGDKLDVGTRIRYCLEAARGMEYLASVDCVHGDLALRNCLIGADDKLKISDFGLSRKGAFNLMESLKKGKLRLPVKWTAPEAYVQGFSSKTDVFSFGVLMWEVFANGKEPWAQMDNRSVMRMVNEGKRMQAPSDTPEEVVCLMRRCWGGDPERRPTFTEIRTMLAPIATKLPPRSRSSRSSRLSRTQITSTRK